MPEPTDVTPDSSPASALENAIASSPEVTEQQQTQEAQTQPAETEGVTQEQVTTPEEEGRIPYSRFKEKVDEANYLKSLLERQMQAQQAQQPIQQPTQSPYANMNPEEERFWRAVDERAEKIAERKFQSVTPIIDAGRMELAQMKVGQFRSSHPDIKPDSPEEMAIAQRISAGYSTDDAYWSVMGPRGIRVAEEKGKQQVKQQIVAKKQANVENSASVPTQAQPKPKLSFREQMRKNLELAEQGKL